MKTEKTVEQINREETRLIVLLLILSPVFLIAVRVFGWQ